MTLQTLFSARLRELESLTLRPETSASVCPDSTPVLFFGRLQDAEIVTVGINPSWREFLTSAGTPLPDGLRRFLHRSELSGDARDAHDALARMGDYFNPGANAFWQWFRRIERLANAFDCSLQAGTAAHTDALSCFATYPAWGKLANRERALFARSGYETFATVLRSAPRLRLLVVCGEKARREVERGAKCALNDVSTSLDDLPKLAVFRPALAAGKLTVRDRSVPVISVRPYWNVPTAPLSYAEIDAIPRLLRGLAA